ncbi:MAG: ribonuclease E/G [Caulobacteraceae bacterium]|nr:ribonuclease E/G [Caulobacteraceae bacterium]
MSRRRLYLDRAPGEDRAVVTLDGRPERFLIERPSEPFDLALSSQWVGRVARIERGLASAFLDLGEGGEALLALTGDGKAVAEGAWIEIEITAEARRGKLALARMLGPSTGPARRLDRAKPLIDRLKAFAPGVAVIEGAAAREVADEAESEMLAIEHALPGGGSIAIEPTRALTAVDVDLGARGADARRAARQVNLLAIEHCARLLRLKGLGGLVVIDLVGAGHDGASLTAAATKAFAPDMPGVSIGPITRFGTFQIAIPRRWRPAAEILCDESGAITTVSLALRLLRAMEREGRADGGARILGYCAQDVGEAAKILAPALSDRIGARFDLILEPSRRREHLEVTRR